MIIRKMKETINLSCTDHVPFIRDHVPFISDIAALYLIMIAILALARS